MEDAYMPYMPAKIVLSITVKNSDWDPRAKNYIRTSLLFIELFDFPTRNVTVIIPHPLGHSR